MRFEKKMLEIPFYLMQDRQYQGGASRDNWGDNVEIA